MPNNPLEFCTYADSEGKIKFLTDFIPQVIATYEMELRRNLDGQFPGAVYNAMDTALTRHILTPALDSIAAKEQPVELPGDIDHALSCVSNAVKEHSGRCLDRRFLLEIGKAFDMVKTALATKREISYPDFITATDGTKVLIDPEDYPVLSRHNWYINYSGDRPYAITKLKTDQSTIWRCIFMHHMILGTSAVTDHEDTNSLNNRKHNLRAATRTENEWNKPKQKTAAGKPPTSKYKGVCLSHGRWLAQIKRNGVHYKLGYFANEEDAARAYNAKAIELSGKFVWVNQLPPLTKTPRIEGQS